MGQGTRGEPAAPVGSSSPFEGIPISSSARNILLSLLAWIAVGLFWLVTTRDFHPTWPLAIVATGSLLTCYAAASYVNLLILVPRYLRGGRAGIYAAALAGVMVVFTAMAIVVLRTYYIHVIGAGSVHSLELDFALDFFGMVVHVTGAAGVVWIASRWAPGRAVSSRP